MKKIAVIGGGVFGCSAALELAKDFDVTIFERAGEIFTGASTVNHLRHHYGFHYPRSKETVMEIKISRKSFEREYGECVSESFEDYYGVSKTKSKTSPEEFIRFCDLFRLHYELAWPDKEFMDRSKIGVCIKTSERVYDPGILKEIILSRIKERFVELRLNQKIVGGDVHGKIKKLKVESDSGTYETDEFNYVVNATYSNFNSFNRWFGYQRKRLQYELVELLELDIPVSRRIGLTILDGEFSSVLPRGEKGTFTLGHVEASVLERVVSDDIDTVVMASENVKSNKDEILRRGVEDFPFLRNASVLASLFVTRVVKPDVEETDERPSEISEYGNGMYSIFGGKVITCVDIAEKISMIIKNENGK